MEENKASVQNTSEFKEELNYWLWIVPHDWGHPTETEEETNVDLFEGRM